MIEGIRDKAVLPPITGKRREGRGAVGWPGTDLMERQTETDKETHREAEKRTERDTQRGVEHLARLGLT